MSAPEVQQNPEPVKRQQPETHTFLFALGVLILLISIVMMFNGVLGRALFMLILGAVVIGINHVTHTQKL